MYKKEKFNKIRSKIWTSKPEFKHTNNEVIINIYIYDKIQSKYGKAKSIFLKSKTFKKQILNKLAKLNKLNKKYIKYINSLHIDNPKLYNSIKLLINNKNIKNVKKFFRKEIKALWLKRASWLNSLKYKETFMKILHNLLNRIYKKKVILNVINLKHKYLNIDILTKYLANKSKDRKRNVRAIFDKSMSNITTPMFRRNIINKILNTKYKQNTSIKKMKKYNINTIINKNYRYIKNNIEYNILDNINNKLVIGIRLEAAGRLTKRFTAQRAVKHIKYKGTIKNIDSSFRGLSTQIVRNNISSNLQFSRASSKNRIGSFGIKGWISSV